MLIQRPLPEKRNYLLETSHTPQLDILIERRRLGQTDLVVKPGQVGLTNVTQAKSLGRFDYAHLRAPLPKDLRDSGIFTAQKGAYPEAYFLMRRSSDGFISATGMFKAAFPWATLEEETTERKHHKALSSAGPEEVAGNVWISPEEALELATEYGMRPWIVALLDPEPIEKGTKEKGTISTPPKFFMPDKSLIPTPSQASPARARRTRELRSASPTKMSTTSTTTPARKIATPRKPRSTRAKKSDGPALENGTQESVKGSVEPESVNGDAQPLKTPTETVTVTVDQETAEMDGVETKETHVRVEMPAGHPDLPLPEDPKEIIETAKKMVEEANELEDKRLSAVKSLKRKADTAEDDDESNKLEIQPVKKVKKLEDEVRKQKVKTRAFIGVATVTFLGAAITYFM